MNFSCRGVRRIARFWHSKAYAVISYDAAPLKLSFSHHARHFVPTPHHSLLWKYFLREAKLSSLFNGISIEP